MVWGGIQCTGAGGKASQAVRQPRTRDKVSAEEIKKKRKKPPKLACVGGGKWVDGSRFWSLVVYGEEWMTRG